MEANYKSSKKRGSVESPSYTALSEQMGQGGGYKNGTPPRSLSDQMGQPGGYDHPFECKSLGSYMGQR